MNERVQAAIDAAMAAAYAWRDAVVLCVDPDAEDGDVFALAEARHGLVKQAIKNVALVAAIEEHKWTCCPRAGLTGETVRCNRYRELEESMHSKRGDR